MQLVFELNELGTCVSVSLIQMRRTQPGQFRPRKSVGNSATALRRRNLLSLCVYLAFVLFDALVFAKAPIGTPLQYTRTVWRVSDGLPEDTVQALTESKDGLLWIGTTGGLARFDGAHIQLYGPGMAKALSVNSIFCLTLGRDGSLWAGTEGGGLLRLRGNGLRVYSTSDGLTEAFVRTVFEDDRGRVWVGTDNGLFVLEGERLRRVDQGAITPMGVHSITEDHDHRIWAGGSQLIAIDPDGTAKVFSVPGSYSETAVKRILETSDGTVWVGTVGGLQKLVDGQFRTVPGIHATVRTLLQTSDGTLWIGTIGEGLWTYRDGRLTRMSGPGILPSDTVLSIFEDDQGQIWIGTQAGLVRLNRTMVSLGSGTSPVPHTRSHGASVGLSRHWHGASPQCVPRSRRLSVDRHGWWRCVQHTGCGDPSLHRSGRVDEQLHPRVSGES